jgi:lipid-binding SYLF domain-containing protein
MNIHQKDTDIHNDIVDKPKWEPAVSEGEIGVNMHPRKEVSVISRKTSTFRRGTLTAGIMAMALGLAIPTSPAYAQSTSSEAMTNNQAYAKPSLDQNVMSTLRECQRVSASCTAETKAAAGILVFPKVIKADLLIGGAGGKGALIENGQITGYYNIGAGTAGLEAGIDQSSQVYVFRNAQALSKLKSGPEMQVGASAGVTVVTANANAKAISGDILSYAFDSRGLHGDVAVDVFDVWKSGQQRPQH